MIKKIIYNFKYYAFIANFVCIFFIINNAQAQYSRANPLFTFMQANFDSTIVFFPFSNWDGAPNYYIVGKKDNQIFSFTYINPYRVAKKYPDTLKRNFTLKQLKFKATIPDINEYFLPKNSNDSLLKIFWATLVNNNIWALNGVSSENCIGKDSVKHSIQDGAEFCFFLFTNQVNKSAYFYDPEFFEEQCPGNGERAQAIKAINLFYNLFKNK